MNWGRLPTTVRIFTGAAYAAAPTTDVDQSITEEGLHHVAVQPELLGIEPQSQPDHLREMQDRHVELAADDPFGDGLLEVEVEVAEGARGDEAVRVGVDGIPEVAAGLLERGRLVHRDDREAAALAHPGVLDHGAAERVDDLMQVVVAGVLGVDPEAVARDGRCSTRRRARP